MVLISINLFHCNRICPIIVFLDYFSYNTQKLKMPKTGLHWFRNTLRIHDNPALVSCMNEVERFIPIFIFDGKTAGLAHLNNYIFN